MPIAEGQGSVIRLELRLQPITSRTRPQHLCVSCNELRIDVWHAPRHLEPRPYHSFHVSSLLATHLIRPGQRCLFPRLAFPVFALKCATIPLPILANSKTISRSGDLILSHTHAELHSLDLPSHRRPGGFHSKVGSVVICKPHPAWILIIDRRAVMGGVIPKS